MMLRRVINLRKYSDMASYQKALYAELRGTEANYKQLNLDAVMDPVEVDALLKDGKINQSTADYMKHSITRQKEAASNSKPKWCGFTIFAV